VSSTRSSMNRSKIFRSMTPVSSTPSVSASSELRLSSSMSISTSEEDTFPKKRNLIDEDSYNSDDSVLDPPFITQNEPQSLQPQIFQCSCDNCEDEPNNPPEVQSENYIWEKTVEIPTRYIQFDFVETIGPNTNIQTENPIDYFQIFFNKEL